MRTAVLAIVAAMAATSASAVELGYGLALNTDVVVEHKFDAEATTLTINPELAYAPAPVAGLSLTAGMTLNAWDNTNGMTIADEFDVLPVVDFGATFTPAAAPNVELELGTSYDFEAEARGEITATATFSF